MTAGGEKPRWVVLGIVAGLMGLLPVLVSLAALPSQFLLVVAGEVMLLPVLICAIRPRRPILLVIAAVMVVGPSLCLFLWLFLMLVSAVLSATSEPGSMKTLLGAILLPAPFGGLLVCEYLAVVRRSPAATLLMTELMVLVVGVMGVVLVRGVLGVSGVVSLYPNLPNWGENALWVGLMSGFAFVGIAHLRWYRQLAKAASAPPAAPADGSDGSGRPEERAHDGHVLPR